MTKHSPASSVRIEEHVDGIVSSIGPKVKKLRQEQRLSLQQLAIKAEVSAAAIHKIERNDMVPTITTLLKIATALDRPVTYFVEDEGQPDPVAFTPAGDRPAVFTPHEGLTLEGVSGPVRPFPQRRRGGHRLARREQWVQAARPCGRGAGLHSRRQAGVRDRRGTPRGRGRRRAAFHGRPTPSLGE